MTNRSKKTIAKIANTITTDKNMDRLLEMIRTLEGLRLEAYQCSAGVWTIGYGHTKGVRKGSKCTMEQADKWLAEEVADFRAKVVELLPEGLDDCKIDALTSFAYNVGLDALKTSTLLQIVKEDNNDLRIVKQFSRWCKSKGCVIIGLLRRRRKECELYFEDYENKTALRKAIVASFDSVI
jgi:lysozyme